MKLIPQSISEVLLIEPEVHYDERGYFIETYREDLLSEALGYKLNFIQDNESKSNSKGVLRGLHYQLPPFTQSKLVRVTEGSVLDIAVDIRRNSITFGQHVSVEISSQNKRQVFIPKGFAHGFVVLSDEAIFSYKVDQYYSAAHNSGIAYDDNDIDIDWGFPKEDLILSKADQGYPKIANNINLL
jgi:dTDP-4-dehydrorhamnose 3,5-epimerase